MNKKLIQTKKLIVSGLVQGVGFRYCTYRLAKQLNIKGTVENLSNGEVKIIAQGNINKIKVFILKIKASPTPAGKVSNIRVTKINQPLFSHFNIK